MTGIEDCQPFGEGYTWTGTMDESWLYAPSMTGKEAWERAWGVDPGGGSTVYRMEIEPYRIKIGNIHSTEGENKMEKQLTDLVLRLKLEKEEVDEIREIAGHSDWRDRFMLYLLACAVQDGSVEAEALGYERKEK